nr:MAG TPA: hypothetical protein [Caudoviricetes sp.]
MKKHSTLFVALLTIFTLGYLGKYIQSNFRDTISKLFKLK